MIDLNFYDICAMFWLIAMRLRYTPALMKPKATRVDCWLCNKRDLDSDGVPDGCNSPTGRCVHPDRRDPWDGSIKSTYKVKEVL